MKREYQLIVFTYIAMQLLSGFGVQLTAEIIKNFGFSGEELTYKAISIWLVLSFSITLLITLMLLRHEYRLKTQDALPFFSSAAWAIGGVFLALFSQIIAVQIELLIGIKPGSENTENIMSIIQKAPAVILVSSVFGPILEEIVFRKILFGSLYRKYNFWISGLISSVIFGLAHSEPEHIILYSAIGFTFAFLYVKTKRIIVPIVTHVLMNTMVVLVQIASTNNTETALHTIKTLLHLYNLFFNLYYCNHL